MDTTKFSQRVQQFQCELKAPKGQTNKFGGYKYRSCEDIMEAVKPLLAKYQMFLNVTDELVCVGGPDESRFYVKATATLSDSESSNSVWATAYAREAAQKKGMDDSQVTGTASSYARKYALNGLLCIDDTRDADTDEYAERTDSKSANDALFEKIKCENCGKDIHPVNDGKKGYLPREIAAMSKKAYGKSLCWQCAAKEKARMDAEKSKEAPKE